MDWNRLAHLDQEDLRRRKSLLCCVMLGLSHDIIWKGKPLQQDAVAIPLFTGVDTYLPSEIPDEGIGPALQELSNCDTFSASWWQQHEGCTCIRM